MNESLASLIKQHIPNAQVITDDDGHHYSFTIISSEFADKSKVKRQQLVYKALGDLITSGAVHAVSISTFTPEEWESKHNG